VLRCCLLEPSLNLFTSGRSFHSKSPEQTSPLLKLVYSVFFTLVSLSPQPLSLKPTTDTMAAVPPGGTFFDTLKRSFSDVPIESGKIATTEFLEACEGLTTLFGVYVQSSTLSCSNKARCPRFRCLQACQVRHGRQHQGICAILDNYIRRLTSPENP
jgi:hypothetical protein